MRRVAKFNKRRIVLILLAVAAIGSLLSPRMADTLRLPAHYALAPLSDLSMSAAAAFKSRLSNRGQPVLSTQEAARLRHELDRLRHKVEALRRWGNGWKDRCREIQNIRHAYGPIRATYELIPARVVLREALPYVQSLTITGALDGVRRGVQVVEVMTDRSKALPKGLAAITASFLVGRVEVAGRLCARIQLVTDRGFKAPATLRRDPGIPRRITVTTPEGSADRRLTRANNNPIPVQVRGNGNNELVVEDIAKHHNIRPGDFVWTTGTAAALPVELLIGKVVRVETSGKNPNFVTVYVSPAAELTALHNVYIVRPLASELPPPKERR